MKARDWIDRLPGLLNVAGRATFGAVRQGNRVPSERMLGVLAINESGSVEMAGNERPPGCGLQIALEEQGLAFRWELDCNSEAPGAEGSSINGPAGVVRSEALCDVRSHTDVQTLALEGSDDVDEAFLDPAHGCLVCKTSDVVV